MAGRVEMEIRGRLARLFGNLGWKVLALVLAVACWFFIASARESFRELAAPVEITGVDEGCVVNGNIPARIQLRVAGKGRDLLRARAEDFKVTVNLAGKNPGVYRLNLTPADVVYTGKGNIRVAEVLGERILILEVQRYITKTVPVRVMFKGLPKTGWYVGAPMVRPATATLYGAGAVLDKIQAIAAVVDAAGRDAPFTTRVPVTVPAGVTLVGGDEVEVTVPVGPGERRTFRSKVTAKLTGDRVYRITPPEVAVVLEGEATRLATLEPPRVTVAPRGAGRYPVRVDVPDYVTFVSVTPDAVEVAPTAQME